MLRHELGRKLVIDADQGGNLIVGQAVDDGLICGIKRGRGVNYPGILKLFKFRHVKLLYTRVELLRGQEWRVRCGSQHRYGPGSLRFPNGTTREMIVKLTVQDRRCAIPRRAGKHNRPEHILSCWGAAASCRIPTLRQFC